MNTSQSIRSSRKLRVAFLTPSLHIGGAERWILSLARNFQNVQPAGVVVCSPHHHPDMLEEAARLMPVYVARKYGDARETRRLLERCCITADVLITWGVPRLAMVTRRLVGRNAIPSVAIDGRVANPSYDQSYSFSRTRTRTSSSMDDAGGSHFEDEKTRTKYEDEIHSRRIDNPPYIPVIDVSHSDGAWEQQTKMVRRAASGADFHVAVSRCALSAFPEQVRSRATVIYNGVEADRVAPRQFLPLPPFPATRREGRAEGSREICTRNSRRVSPHPKPLPEGEGTKRTALFLGRFEEVKGFDRLFVAAKHLPANWKIVAHGHGSLQSQIANRKSQIEIRPPLNHVGDALASADVLVMPSRHEGMPLTLIEAWLAGTPVVATPFGFIQEATQMHGRLCEVVSQNPSGKELADGIVRAAGGRFVDHARQIAWNHYTAAAMAQRWEEYLYEVCSVFGFQCSEAGASNRKPKTEN